MRACRVRTPGVVSLFVGRFVGRFDAGRVDDEYRRLDPVLPRIRFDAGRRRTPLPPARGLQSGAGDDADGCGERQDQSPLRNAEPAVVRAHWLLHGWREASLIGRATTAFQF